MQNIANFSDEPETDALPPGSQLLYGQYTIERHLIDGGFGMTYIARDSLERRVVIKESFPTAICRRLGGEVRPRKPDYQEQYQRVIRNFLREALRLAKLDHPNIVKVYQVFQENNTAYIAMEFVDGKDLFTILEEEPSRLSHDLLRKLLRETLMALSHVHDYDMLHRDISPDNLILDEDGTLTLIDFGAAREDRSEQFRALSTVLSVKDGYSPHEFYYANGTHEPSSDIYSVGATFYHLITGGAPPDCQKRLADLSSGLPDPYVPLTSGSAVRDDGFLSGIDRALAVSQDRRFQSVEEWLDFLDLAETAPAPKGRVRAPKTILHTNQNELGPNLAMVISSLVEDTNSAIEPELRAERARAAGQPSGLQPEPEENRLVDLLGNPIEDVDRWLREQDRLSRKKHARDPSAAHGRNVGPQSGPGGQTSWLKRTLGALVKR
ncbi:serine/threonine protein kinase [Ponticoccus sp. SC2-23]|uniref:serine/threonine protein kinase n=1 Tax=Alexandriicola marinus TaxID=2081710 RepID=UPI000FDC4A89|nr:serine/threonine-protein kinase [Alexandriicola marinus]MBM1218758.1 serine/threonine protein kinase [Ponticoccus sp. SC6-9]MBM1224170.1 serine/threonine protein kinase [Ponticoccus sp. SC6-15]MBM1230051.1 serine/threonine protein kinase [Ponticoccus sp. SC6-38]MBM1233136.1 serine/threonine protein kinase [Ponticoccus sp. SC6-45]MBM1236914.1 serine/threonine protein kinase [Ponticoccus sp. SC6-49]MBM1242147.1 serine/threonine protein kinase [Ponticoccus sp. SC2-64]MBM1246660.1 serine/thre